MKSKQLFFGLIGLLVLAVGSFGTGYYLMVKRVQAQTLSLAKLAADDTVMGERLDQLNDLAKQYQSLQPVLQKLDQALPRTKQQSEVILQIQQLAAQSGMKLPSANFQATSGLPSTTSQTVKAGSALALPISFQLTGTYAQLQSFLQRVEGLGRYSNIQQLAITRADNKSNSSLLSFSISLNVYVKP